MQLLPAAPLIPSDANAEASHQSGNLQWVKTTPLRDAFPTSNLFCGLSLCENGELRNVRCNLSFFYFPAKPGEKRQKDLTAWPKICQVCHSRFLPGRKGLLPNILSRKSNARSLQRSRLKTCKVGG